MKKFYPNIYILLSLHCSDKHGITKWLEIDWLKINLIMVQMQFCDILLDTKMPVKS